MTYLPPFNEISVFGHIPLHGTQITAQFGCPMENYPLEEGIENTRKT